GLARWRWRGDPLAHDAAPARAALALWDGLTPQRTELFRRDAERSPLGVPASEPTWVRPLDAVLAAAALETLEERALPSHWSMGRDVVLGDRPRQRPSNVHTPTGFRLGTVPAWEAVTACALARER